MMKISHNSAHLLFIFAGTLFVVCATYVGWLAWSIRTPAPQIEAVAEVLGAKTSTPLPEVAGAVNCPDQEWLKQQVLREVPAVYFEGLGKDNKVISTSDLFSCIQLPGCSEKTLSCTALHFVIDETCLANAIQQKKLFSQTLTKMNDTLDNGTPASVVVRQEDYLLDFPALAKVTAQLLNTRLNFCALNSGEFKNEKLFVPIPVKVDMPNTDGTMSNKYIEVDGSRQLMWLWKDGKVVKKYSTSGAFAEYNPVGIHQMLNKSRRAWSSTAKKWMPYWMAFTYDKKQKTWFGIHALVYWFPNFETTGEYAIKEPESNIGKPRSTGCIRLGNKEAEEVYNWTNVGDLLVVHD